MNDSTLTDEELEKWNRDLINSWPSLQKKDATHGDKIKFLKKWAELLEGSPNRDHHQPFIKLLREKMQELNRHADL